MKPIKLLLAIVAMGLLAFTSHAQSSLTNGLVAYYPFNGNVNDASGNGNNGTIHGGVVLAPDRFGSNNSAYTFNGVDGYIDVGNPVGNSPSNLTETAWVKIISRATTGIIPEDIIITKRQTGNIGSGWPDLVVESTAPNAGAGEIMVEGDNYLAQYYGTSRTQTNVWFFICEVSSNNTYQIYVNGVLENTVTDSHPLNSVENMYLMHCGALGTYCHGLLDDVRIYNRALSSNEVAQIYAIENAAPTITAQPTNVTVNVGDTASFSVTANGVNPLNYQWFKDGISLLNATNATLMLTNVQPPRVGNYTVAIAYSDGGGSVTSSAASLNIPNVNPALWQGLAAYYPFNGNVNDASGNGNDGVIHGGVVLAPDRFGSNNSAYTFNGVDGYIDIGNPVGNSPASLTETAWVKITSRETSGIVPEDVIITKRQTGNIGSGWSDLVVESSGPNAGAGEVIVEADNYFAPYLGTSHTQTNVWFFICEVKSNNTYQIYVNGALENTVTDSHPLNSVENMYLMHDGAWGTYCHGLLDDVRIYNRALSSNEVAQIYAVENTASTVNPPASCDPPPSGLVSWWAAEGNALDQIGGNNGTLVGNTIYGPGKVAQGFAFDGDGDGVQIGSATNLELQNFTIETWIKRASPSVVSFSSGTSAIIFGYGTGGYLFFLDTLGDLTFCQLGNPADVSGPAITDTNLHHVAVTKIGSTIVFYLDGVAYPVSAYNVNFTFTGGPAIGCLPTSEDDSFLGTIDELSFYNRALSALEIQAIYNAGSEGKCFTPAPTITAQPTNVTVNVGDTASFSVTASGVASLNYQWFKDGVSLPNATNAKLILPDVQPPRIGNYTVAIISSSGSITSSIASLSISNVNSALWQGLVAYYPFSGNANDAEGTNNGINIQATLSADRFGNPNQAYSFNGTNSFIGFANVPTAQTDNWTMTAWVEPASLNQLGIAVALGFDNGSSGNGYSLGIFNNNSNPGNLLGAIFGSVGVFSGGFAFTSNTQWYQIVMLRNSGVTTFYVDGIPTATGITATPLTPTTFRIGAENGIRFFNGAIDDVRIYNRALASNDVAQLYASEAPPHAATAIATLFGAFVVSNNITDGGAGYTNAPLVRFIGGGGSGATAVAVVSNGVVTAINMISAGSGYTNAPLIVIDPPFVSNPVLGIAPISILAFSNITIGSSYQLQQFQSWYWTNQPISFTAGSAFYTQVVSGATSAGEYRLALNPVPAQAFAVAQVVNGFVVGVTNTAGGSGYGATPAVNIVGDVGSNATAVVDSISGGAVTHISITNPGIGYTNQVTVQIDPPPAVALSPTISPGVILNSSSLAPYDNYQVQFESDLTGTWGNLAGGLFIPIAQTNSQFIVITNGIGFFRLQYLP
jgi:Concanavalin A-like lectin/glucanases superfamily/Immunoglobulin domain